MLGACPAGLVGSSPAQHLVRPRRAQCSGGSLFKLREAGTGLERAARSRRRARQAARQAGDPLGQLGAHVLLAPHHNGAQHRQRHIVPPQVALDELQVGPKLQAAGPQARTSAAQQRALQGVQVDLAASLQAPRTQTEAAPAAQPPLPRHTLNKPAHNPTPSFPPYPHPVRACVYTIALRVGSRLLETVPPGGTAAPASYSRRSRYTHLREGPDGVQAGAAMSHAAAG